jgi:hypothetical protein
MDLTWKIISSPIFILLMCLYYNFGICSSVIVSQFLNDYDNKKDILKEVRSQLFSPDKGQFFVALINSLPFMSWCVLLYFGLLYWRIKLSWFPSFFTTGGITLLIVLPFYQLILYPSYILYGFSQDSVEISQNGSIRYKFPFWFIFCIFCSLVLFMFVESNIPKDNLRRIWSFFGIHNLQDYNFISIYCIAGLLSYFVVFKPVSRFLVRQDYLLNLERLKDQKVEYTQTITGIVAVLSTSIFIASTLYFALTLDFSKISFPLGDTIITVCLCFMGAALSGQRKWYLSLNKNYVFKSGHYYYKNSKGVLKRLAGQ